ncbi:MAG: EpsG family protein [Mogibacterium sp.]|nr:EpsG family protein [Mogibacterium sp.]
MSVYILIILWPAALYAISRMTSGIYEIDPVSGELTDRVTKGFAIFSVIPLIYWAAARYEQFGDTNAYMKMFYSLPEKIGAAVTYISECDKDPGFYILSIIIKMITGGNVRLYLGAIAAFQLVILALIMRKHSSGFITGIFAFIASTDYMSWTFNGVRQFTAVIISFAACSFLFEGKYVKYCLMILLASTFHLSALMMIPIAFVALSKPWQIRTFLLIAAFAIAIAYIGSVTSWLDDALAETQYENVVTEWQITQDDGTNPLRVLVYSMPTILSFIGLRYIREANNRSLDIVCNMSIAASILYIFSILTSGIYIGRLPIYCSLYGMEILLPWEIKNMFSENSAKIISIIMVASFLVFYYYQMHFAWGAI